MEQEFHRIKRLPPYVFAEVNALKSKARAAGADIVDFGMGNCEVTSESAWYAGISVVRAVR